MLLFPLSVPIIKGIINSLMQYISYLQRTKRHCYFLKKVKFLKKTAIKKSMVSETELNEKLIENWKYLNPNQRKLLKNIGILPDKQ